MNRPKQSNPLVIMLAVILTWSMQGIVFAAHPTTPQTKPLNPQSQRTYVVGFAQDTLSNDWRTAQVQELQQALAQYPFIHFIYTDAQGQTAKQILDIEDLITRGIDLLVTSPRDAKALTPVISKAYHQGIPVVLLTRHIESEDYTLFIGGNDLAIGQQAARYLQKRLAGHGRILMLKGVPTASTTINRTLGFKQEIIKQDGMKIIAEKTANYLRNDAIHAMEEVLNAGIQFDAIYAQSDSMAHGARMALRKAGINPRDIPIVGIDYISEAREAMRTGEQDISFTYPTGGREGAENIVKILRGEPIPKEILLDSIMITPDNMEQFDPIF